MTGFTSTSLLHKQVGDIWIITADEPLNEGKAHYANNLLLLSLDEISDKVKNYTPMEAEGARHRADILKAKNKTEVIK